MVGEDRSFPAVVAADDREFGVTVFLPAVDGLHDGGPAWVVTALAASADDQLSLLRSQPPLTLRWDDDREVEIVKVGKDEELDAAKWTRVQLKGAGVAPF